MRRVLFAAVLSLAPVAFAGAAEKKPEPPPLPHSDRMDDPTVLIRGDPPLTQGAMDRFLDAWEWVLDLRLTERQRAEGQQLWMDGWKKKDDKGKAQWLSNIRGCVKFWEDIAKLDESQRDLRRLHLQAPGLAALRKSSDEIDRWWPALYDEAHKPGGERNAILVASDPPLTQDMMDLYRMAMEYVLDFRMTDRQRDEYQRLCVEDWKKNDPQQWSKNIETWRRPLSDGPYNRRVWRAQQRQPLLDSLRKPKWEEQRWLLAAYEEAHKPGGERNPILAAGDPPLTRDLVDRYCDMAEGVLDFSISGGLTAAQRQDLEDLLVKDWKGLDKEARDDLVQAAQKWPTQARLLAQLRSASAGDQRSQYLREIHKREQEKLASALEEIQRQSDIRRTMNQQMHEAEMNIIRSIGPSGHYEYNPATERYDRYVPDR